MSDQSPDPRHVRLASEYGSEWHEGTVERHDSGELAVKLYGHTTTYAVPETRRVFEVGDKVEICPDWSLARRDDVVVVILPSDQGPEPSFDFRSALPADALEWTPATRAGWLYGYQQWLQDEDWIDVSFLSLDDDSEFEAAAFEAYTDLHLAESDEDSD